MTASRGRRSVVGVVIGVLLLAFSTVPASRSDEPVLSVALVVAAVVAGTGAACLREPSRRAVGIAVVFLVGGVLVRLLTGDGDLTAAWFLAGMAGIGIGASLSRHVA